MAAFVLLKVTIKELEEEFGGLRGRSFSDVI